MVAHVGRFSVPEHPGDIWTIGLIAGGNDLYDSPVATPFDWVAGGAPSIVSSFVHSISLGYQPKGVARLDDGFTLPSCAAVFNPWPSPRRCEIIVSPVDCRRGCSSFKNVLVEMQSDRHRIPLWPSTTE